MSKYDEGQKDNQGLERNINTFLRKSIEGASKQYKKKFHERKSYECCLSDINQIIENKEDIFSSLFKDELSLEAIQFEEQHFENLLFLKAFQKLSASQKVVIYPKYVFDLSEPIIASIIGISKQAVSKRRKAALRLLLDNYSGIATINK